MPKLDLAEDYSPFQYGHLELSHLLILATIAHAAATGAQSGSRRSATQIVTDRLGVSRGRLHKALVRLEDVFGNDLQHDTELRRSGRLTDKGRALAAAAGMLQFWLTQIDDPNADHSKILARLEAEFENLEGLPNDAFKAVAGTRRF